MRARSTPRDRSPLPRAPDLATIDVSFISLAKVLGAVLGCLGGGLRRARAGQAAVRGRARARRQGRRRARRRDAPRGADRGRPGGARARRRACVGYASSGLPGPKGNRETFLWLADPASAATAARRVLDEARAPELERLAREVEP